MGSGGLRAYFLGAGFGGLCGIWGLGAETGATGYWLCAVSLEVAQS